MRVGLAQFLERVRREIDDQQPSAGPQRPRRLAHGARAVVEEVQRPDATPRGRTVALHGQRKDVALADLRVGDAGARQVGARQREHVAVGVDADGAPDMRAEEFQHAAGAGAEIEQRLRSEPRRRRRG